MPELPEVQTMCRGIAGIVGTRIRDLRRPKSRLQPIQVSPRIADFRRRVVGRKIKAVGRLGKRVVVDLDGGDRIVFEPRMTGLVLPADPPELEHLRLVFDLTGSQARQLLFWDRRGLGVVRLLSPPEFAAACGPDKLGPDALDISLKVLRQRLGKSRRAIKVALMDQRALTGVGNLYASEILHRARLHPQRPCCQLRAPEWRRLHTALRQVLREATGCEGSTLSDGTYRVARERFGRYQSRHRVYRRAGQACAQCRKGNVVRIVQAQRSTFYCPVCQPAGRFFSR